MKRINERQFLILVGLCVIGFSILGIFFGTVNIINNPGLSKDACLDILRLRVLRVLLAIVAGGGLSLSGIGLQAILRNPLAEPYVLGISSGAGLGAVIGTLFFSSSYPVNIPAFAGGVLAVVIVYCLSRIDNKVSTESMILAGVAVNALFSGLLMFFISNSSSQKVHSVIWWLLGSLQIYRITQLFPLGLIILTGLLVMFIFSKWLNAISLGEEEALHLGVDTEKIKSIAVFVATIMTAEIVSVCGIIGFVGLMVPHIARRLLGPNHFIIVPGSFLLGALFLLVCDIFSRVVFSFVELPIGVITTLFGAPFFIYILRRTRRGYFS